MTKIEEINNLLLLIKNTKNKFKILKLNSRKINYKTLLFIFIGNLVAFVLLPKFGLNVSFLGTICGGFAIGVASSYFIGSIFKDIEEEQAFGKTIHMLRKTNFGLNTKINPELLHLIEGKSNMGYLKNRGDFEKYYDDIIYILDEYSYALNKELVLELTEAQNKNTDEKIKEFKMIDMKFE
jgi:hypothetical protein